MSNEPTQLPSADTADKPAVLVVEDSPVNLQLAVMQLEKLGYSAGSAVNGREALDKLQKTPYAIVLMDCQMPEMDGFEATWQIRNNEKSGAEGADVSKPLHIIAMTADSAEDSREKCLAAGMNDYIRKPVQLTELEAALNRALNGPGAGSDVLDPLVLAGLRMLRQPGKPDPVADLAGMFMDDAPKKLDVIEEAAGANDMWSMSKIVAASTSLKGSAANLGARDLVTLCAQIEDLGRNGSLQEIGALLTQARAELDRIREALEKLS